MLLQLQSLFMGEKTSLPIDCTLDFSELEWNGLYPFKQPVNVKGEVRHTADVVTLKADVSYCYDGI